MAKKKQTDGLTDHDREMLQNKINGEGFDYCFIKYSSWNEITDTEFHRLRSAYVEAAGALKKYIGDPE